jgi:hypothetical protein
MVYLVNEYPELSYHVALFKVEVVLPVVTVVCVLVAVGVTIKA